MKNFIFYAEDGDTEISPEEQLDLIPSITTRKELNQIERLNIKTARVWAMRKSVLCRSDLLTDGFARELHRRMFNHVWVWAGRYRKTEKNIGWEVHRLQEGVRIAYDDANYWIKHSAYSLPESAVRLHHRLVSIHPWPNGNGRHSRLIADILVASLGGTPLTWGACSENLSNEKIREHYITAIRSADAGDMTPLIIFAQS